MVKFSSKCKKLISRSDEKMTVSSNNGVFMSRNIDRYRIELSRKGHHVWGIKWSAFKSTMSSPRYRVSQSIRWQRYQPLSYKIQQRLVEHCNINLPFPEFPERLKVTYHSLVRLVSKEKEGMVRSLKQSSSPCSEKRQFNGREKLFLNLRTHLL